MRCAHRIDRNLQARFRVYGLVQAVFTGDVSESVDLAHVFSGGRVVFVSDQHFGVGSNLLLPGRGEEVQIHSIAEF